MLGNSGTQNELVASWPVALSINPASPNFVMVGMSGPPQQADAGVLLSTDGGSTFTSASTGPGPNPLLYPQPWPDPPFVVAYTQLDRAWRPQRIGTGSTCRATTAAIE